MRIKQNEDMELAAVFTRRDPATVKILTEGAAVCQSRGCRSMEDKIDVMILCGGSATDLPEQTPEYAKLFNVIDSFDTHARIPEHFGNVDAAAKEGGTCRNHFRRLGSGNVLTEQIICQCNPSGWKRLYILGKRCQPGTF